MSQHATVSTAQKCLEVYRQQHNILCNMLDTGDEVLHHLIGSCLFIHILDCLLLIYNLCRYDGVGSDTGQLFSHIFWFFGMSTTLITVIAVCSLVNIRAHEPAKLIYNLSMEDFTAEFALQVNVFLHRLNGPPMGLTAWSLFVVDSQVVVSIAGIFATYFVVLLQFQQSVSTTTPAGLNITTV
ncbi:uncharacterized protein LOC132556249 [Ylistrum balloti]|uniref:uncharacterized protein LOC132556249 n=1 Tax=Ylistrum balloti TaxID=509963 RepID=UPI002905BC8E|nr:uncharacterized protein LOC132556249 [Ylistrum balloti]